MHDINADLRTHFLVLIGLLACLAIIIGLMLNLG